MDYTFLELEEVLEIHKNQIKLYGGSRGVRDLELLNSAIEMPKAGFGDTYLHKDVYEIAAAYLFHITQNHPFVDGNKRTALVCALIFLLYNEKEIDFPKDEVYELVIDVASGKAGKDVIAELFRTQCSR